MNQPITENDYRTAIRFAAEMRQQRNEALDDLEAAQRVVESLADRVYAQSQLLSRKAERRCGRPVHDGQGNVIRCEPREKPNGRE